MRKCSHEKIAIEAAKWRDMYVAHGVDGLRAVTEELRKEADEDTLIAKACGAAAAAAELTIHMRVFDVQLLAAVALCHHTIIEMNTGEGKTLTAALPAYYHALTKGNVHVATVNEYLAERDFYWMKPIYDALGVKVGLTLSSHDPEAKRQAYGCEILYATATELGFDYLRDGIAMDVHARVQNVLRWAIVDEADSILLDEAVTPMLLSSSAEEGVLDCVQADTLVRHLTYHLYVTVEGEAEAHGHGASTDYIADEKRKAVYICPAGIKKAEQYYRFENLFAAANIETYHRVMQAMKAYALMRRDVDYVIEDGRVRIVDRNTGRIMEGRRFSDGLHQAIEAKEGLNIHPQSNTLATITYQSFLLRYQGLCGMTGTAWSARQEFSDTFHANVRRIPPNRPCIRLEQNDAVCKDQDEKLEKLLLKAEEAHSSGRPVLIGTDSVEMSEQVSAALHRAGISHTVLNAKMHAQEAAIIKLAGRSGAVTVATNMAGRGTDILLGAGEAADGKRVRELGGLLILGAQRHFSKRVDDQLKGRAGRQGDPGESLFFIAPDDDVFRLYGGGRPFSARAVKRAQEAAEANAAAARRQALEMDEIVQNQRKHVAAFREQAFSQDELEKVTEQLIKKVLRQAGESLPADMAIDQKGEQYLSALKAVFGEIAVDKRVYATQQEMIDAYAKQMIKTYISRKAQLSGEWPAMLKNVFLYVVDSGWSDYLYALEDIKKSGPVAEKGVISPKTAMVKNSFSLFQEMCEEMERSFLQHVFRMLRQ